MPETDRHKFDALVEQKRAEHSCLVRFERFMECMTPRNQCSTYYRTGSYESCPNHWVQWRLCLQGKIGALQGAAEAEGDAIARERGLAGKHVWDFKPKYEAEAFVRYRIKPRTRTDADVEEVR